MPPHSRGIHSTYALPIVYCFNYTYMYYVRMYNIPLPVTNGGFRPEKCCYHGNVVCASNLSKSAHTMRSTTLHRSKLSLLGNILKRCIYVHMSVCTRALCHMQRKWEWKEGTCSKEAANQVLKLTHLTAHSFSCAVPAAHCLQL